MLSIFTAASLALAPLDDPEAAFGAMPLLSQVEASPNGELYAALVRSNGQSGLAIFEIEPQFKYVQFVADSDNMKITDLMWKRDDRLIFDVEVPGKRYGTPVTETRLGAIDPDSGEIDILYRGDRKKKRPPPQIQTRMVSALPDDPDHVLVQYPAYGTDDTAVMRVNVNRPQRHRIHQGGYRGTRRWVADRKGDVRVLYGLLNEKKPMLKIKAPNGKWKDISHRRAPGAPSFSVVDLSTDPNTAYVVSDHATETRALYTYDITNDAFGEMLFSHPTSDVYDVYLDPQTGELLGAIYAEDEPVTHWFQDSRPKRIIKAVRETMGAESVTLTSLNKTGDVAILRLSEGVTPSQYIVFDTKSGEMTAMPSQYPQLAGVELGQVVPATYEARDGLEIPAFVTLPPGIGSLAEAKDLPFFIHPHGGPNARDFLGFDWLPQYLAHLGYGVLQMNFRGSTGYGTEFEDLGDKEWGQAMQDDITDGVAWLVDRGIADPDRVGIIGGSYGGYAALMGAAKTPDLYTCAISINGVSDLPMLIADQKEFIDGSYATRHIGRLWKDRKMLKENSPARRAEDIQVPVLLIHGEDDRVVPLAQSKRVNRALKRADKDVRFMELPKGSHFLNVNDNRVKALEEISGFLGRCGG